MDRESSVSISEASRILGVSEASLRQWTDEGKIKAFITPGGHRRYSKLELKKFASPRLKTLKARDLAARLEESTASHRETIGTFLRDTPWYNRLDAQSQETLASLGRSLLDLTTRSLLEPSKQEDTLKEVRDVGDSFGQTLVKLGFPLTLSVQAFSQHRDLIMNITTHLIKKHPGLSPRMVETIPVIGRALDEALLSLISAYSPNKDINENTKTGELC